MVLFQFISSPIDEVSDGASIACLVVGGGGQRVEGAGHLYSRHASGMKRIAGRGGNAGNFVGCCAWSLSPPIHSRQVISYLYISVIPPLRVLLAPPPPTLPCCPHQVISYLQNLVSRTFEFQADGFAVSQGLGKDLRAVRGADGWREGGLMPPRKRRSTRSS